jgi:hypothetical protein
MTNNERHRAAEGAARRRGGLHTGDGDRLVGHASKARDDMATRGVGRAWLTAARSGCRSSLHAPRGFARPTRRTAGFTTPDGRMVVRYSVEFELPDGRTQTVTAREEEHVPPAARVSPCPACASRAGTWPVPCACSTVSSTTATRAATTTRTSGAASPSSAPRRRALTGDCARTRRPPCGGTVTRTGSPHLEEPERGRTS